MIGDIACIEGAAVWAAREHFQTLSNRSSAYSVYLYLTCSLSERLSKSRPAGFAEDNRCLHLFARRNIQIGITIQGDFVLTV